MDKKQPRLRRRVIKPTQKDLLTYLPAECRRNLFTKNHEGCLKLKRHQRYVFNRYHPIPDLFFDLIEGWKLKPSESLVLLYLIRLSGWKPGTKFYARCFCTHQEIAKKLNMGLNTVGSALKVLEKKELIINLGIEANIYPDVDNPEKKNIKRVGTKWEVPIIWKLNKLKKLGQKQ